jgi:hypothetical protein
MPTIEGHIPVATIQVDGYPEPYQSIIRIISGMRFQTCWSITSFSVTLQVTVSYIGQEFFHFYISGFPQNPRNWPKTMRLIILGNHFRRGSLFQRHANLQNEAAFCRRIQS